MRSKVRCVTVVRSTPARLRCLSMPAFATWRLPALNLTATQLHQLELLLRLQSAQLVLAAARLPPRVLTLRRRLARLSATWPCGVHSLPRQRRRAVPTLKRVLLLVHMLMRRLMPVFLAAMLALTQLKLTARATMKRGAWALLTQALLMAQLTSAQALRTRASEVSRGLLLNPRPQWAASWIWTAVAALSSYPRCLAARAPAAAGQSMVLASAAWAAPGLAVGSGLWGARPVAIASSARACRRAGRSCEICTQIYTTPSTRRRVCTCTSPLRARTCWMECRHPLPSLRRSSSRPLALLALVLALASAPLLRAGVALVLAWLHQVRLAVLLMVDMGMGMGRWAGRMRAASRCTLQPQQQRPQAMGAGATCSSSSCSSSSSSGGSCSSGLPL